jgi:F-type H+-transporting ATPase subunit b
MPQLDPSFYPSQLFWLALSFIALYLILWRVALPKIASVLSARQERIDDDLEKAAALKQSAEKALAEYEKAMAEAQSRAQAQVRQAQEELAAEAARQHEALSARLAQQIEGAEARIAAAKDAAVANLRAVAVDVAGAAAERLVGLSVGEQDCDKAVEAVMGERG